jgi:hypothetical protein
MRLQELCCAGVGWIHLAQKTDWWLVFVNTVMNAMCNGPTNAFVCNKTLIQMSHIKTLK